MITLEDVKAHLRLDLEADSELDPQLEAMLATAMDHASQYLNRCSRTRYGQRCC